GGDAQPRSDLGDRRHHEVSSANGVPSNAATCFCSATSASARSARFCHRLISRACSASFLSRGSTPRRAGPRFFGAPASSLRSRLALDCKLPGGHCLTHVGREGPALRTLPAVS